jgi:hypothetical protein
LSSIDDRADARKISTPPINIRRGELKRALLALVMATKIDVHNLTEDILAECPTWSAAALGKRIGLTFAIKTTRSIRTIACIDRTPAQMRAYYKQRKRERDNRRIRKMRAETGNDLSPRARRLFAMLNGEWIPSTALVDRMGKHERKLKHDSLRQGVLRAARELGGQIEQKVETGPRGGHVVYMRRSAAKPDISAHQSAGNADEIRAARRSDAIHTVGIPLS